MTGDAQATQVVTYYEAYASSGDYSRRYPAPNPHTWQFLLDRLDRSQPVLDAGCGNGRYAIPLALAGFSVRGIDLSTAMVREASQRASAVGAESVDLQVGNITDLPFPDASFGGALLLFGVLSHLRAPQRAQALAELHRVLRPGGILVVSVPNRFRYSWFSQVRTWTQRAKGRKAGLEAGDIHYHNLIDGRWVGNYYHLFLPTELRALLGEHGFDAQPVRGEALLAETAAAKRRLRPLQSWEAALLRRGSLAPMATHLLCAATKKSPGVGSPPPMTR